MLSNATAFGDSGFVSPGREPGTQQSNYPREVAEAALAHSIVNKVEAAYRRGDLFEKRAALMADWADYRGKVQKSAAIVPIRRKR